MAPLSKLARNSLPKLGCGWAILLVVAGGAFLMGTMGFGIKDGYMMVMSFWSLAGFLAMIFLGMYLAPRGMQLRRNEYDYLISQDLNKTLRQLSTHSHAINDTTSGMHVLRHYSVGELTRHFDSQTNAQITGWLDHRFGMVGWGVGFQIGSVNVGTGKVGIPGRSDVHLKWSGTTRDNLLGDGFIAVIEQNSRYCNGYIVRVAVPSEPASREYITSLLLTLGKGFGEGSHREEALRKNIAGLQSSIHNDTTYVSDRLSAIMRMELNRRPTITIVGIELNEHAVLAGAVKFENDARWYQLFPLRLIQEISEIDIAKLTGTQQLFPPSS